MNKQPRKQVTSKQPIGTWFFKCIQECEFAENTWSPDEVIAVPAGTKVPARAFKKIGRLPYDSACLVLIHGEPAISIGEDEEGHSIILSKQEFHEFPDFALRAVKATPSFGFSPNGVIVSSFDAPRVKWAFLEAYGGYIVRFREAVEESGSKNTALFDPTDAVDIGGLSGWDMARRRKFEWNLLEEYDKWVENGKRGPFEQRLEIRHPGLFQCTGSPFEMFVESARGVTSTPSFSEWAGDELVMLAIVFTDVPGSTALGEKLKDERMSEVRQAHFAQSRKLITQYKGREIKTIGDSFMAAFRSVEKALDYAMALHANPGHPRLTIRAGIHAGPMRVEENDVFSGTVNFAARVKEAIQGAEIWLSDRAKEYLDEGGARRFESLEWEGHPGLQMKGFKAAVTLWRLRK